MSGSAHNRIDWGIVKDQYEWTISGLQGSEDGRWFRGGYSNPASNAVDRHLEVRADQPAVVDRRGGAHREITYRDLFRESATLARWWQSQALGAGDRVYLAGRATVEALVAWLSLARLGAVVVRDRRPLDSEVPERLRATECSWAAVLGDEGMLGSVLRGRGRRRGESLPILTLDSSTEMRVWNYHQALDQAEGMIDAKPVEANTIGVLMYGDRGSPSAYAAVGSLLSWHQTLARIVCLEPGDAVGLLSDLGGLHDLIPLTLAVLTAGGCAVWLDQLDDAAESGPRSGKILASRDRARHIAAGVDRVWVLGTAVHGGAVLKRPRVQGDMTTGVYTTGEDNSGDWARGPGQDQTRMEAFSAEASVDADINVRAAFPDIDDPGVADAVQTIDADGGKCLWIASSVPEDELLARLELKSGQDAEGLRILVVPELPYWVEGTLAVRVLEAIRCGEVRVDLAGLLNPDSVAALVVRVAADRVSDD